MKSVRTLQQVLTVKVEDEKSGFPLGLENLEK